MPSTTRPDGPRHLAGHRRRFVRSTGSELTVAPPAADDDVQAPFAARVHRSRFALALAATVAALPILVLDNLPAAANASEQVSTGLSVAVTQLDAAVTTLPTPTTTVAPTTTTAPVTTVAPPTTSAPVRTVAAAVKPAPPAPPTTQAPAPSGVNGDPNDPATWDRMAQCEAHGNWAANTGNGYYGGLQFSLSTWRHYGGTGYPHQASKATQIQVGKRLQAARGWGAWPACSRKLGYS